MFHWCKHPCLFPTSNYFSILIQQPTAVNPASENDTESTLEPEPFLYVIGRKKLLDAQFRCYNRMEQLPPYEGEGKEKGCVWSIIKALASSMGRNMLNTFNRPAVFMRCTCVYQAAEMPVSHWRAHPTSLHPTSALRTKCTTQCWYLGSRRKRGLRKGESRKWWAVSIPKVKPW